MNIRYEDFSMSILLYEKLTVFSIQFNSIKQEQLFFSLVTIS